MSAWVVVAWAVLLMQFTVISLDVFIGGDEPQPATGICSSR